MIRKYTMTFLCVGLFYVIGLIYFSPSVSADTWSRQPVNEADSINKINEMCSENVPISQGSGGGWNLGSRSNRLYAGYGGYVKDLDVDTLKGVLNYTIVINYKRCGVINNYNTRAFALTGYKTNSDFAAVCPMLGYYNTNRSAAFDCVKYINTTTSNWNNIVGGGSEGYVSSAMRNMFVDRGYIINENGKRPVDLGYRGQVQPVLGSIQTVEMKRSYRIPNWNPENPKSVTLGADNAICMYWIDDAAGGSPSGARFCQNLWIKYDYNPPHSFNDISVDEFVSTGLTRFPEGSQRKKYIEVRPGQEVRWWHYVKNNSKFASPNLRYEILRKDIDPSGREIPLNSYVRNDGSLNPGFEQKGWYDSYTYDASAIGSQGCFAIKVTNIINPSQTKQSEWACAKIIADFTLIPSISINTSPILNQVGAPVSLSTSVNNTGTTPSVPNTVWKLGYVLARNNIGTSNNLRTTSNDICSMGVISGVSEVCGDVTGENAGAMRINRNNIDTSGLNPTNTGAGRTTVRRNIDLGQYVCYYLAVKPHATAVNQDEWRVAIDCKPVAKTPSVHVFGGDVALRNTNLSKYLVDISNFKDNENKIYGSWIEYALISAGRVNKNNSSAGYSLSGVVDSLSSRGNLIFANTGTACNVAIGIGCFADMSSVDSAFKSTGPRTAPSMGSEDKGNGGINGFDHNKLYNRSGVASASVNIQGEVRGRSVVNAANKVVKITGNITNQPTAENYSKIPQLIIFAKDVQISSNVTNVDAWILATGNVFTCDNKTSPANSNECNKPLRVNGAIQAQKLYLSRTAGGDVDSMNQAAEVINLSATSRLSAIGRAEDDSSGPSGSTSRSVWETTFVRELPPRY